MPRPAPAAAPLTAAIVTFGIVARSQESSCISCWRSTWSSNVRRAAVAAHIADTSPPAQKARPAPVTSTAPTSGSTAAPEHGDGAVDHRVGEGIEAVGAVERERGDAVVELEDDILRVRSHRGPPSSARALSPRSPALTNVSIHPSTSDCLRSCSRHTSTASALPGSAEGGAQPSASPSTAGTPSSPSSLHPDSGAVPCPTQKANQLSSAYASAVPPLAAPGFVRERSEAGACVGLGGGGTGAQGDNAGSCGRDQNADARHNGGAVCPLAVAM